jgi:type IV pilus assembly protein PilE
MQINGINISRQAGFTLVELMVVIVIVGILASIAIPGYTDYITGARRDLAQQHLLEIQTRQEQFFMDNKTYASNLAELGFDAAVIGTDLSGDVVAHGDSEEQYAFVNWATDTVGTTVTGYRLGAISWGEQAVRDSACGWLYIEEDGNKWNGTSKDCW